MKILLVDDDADFAQAVSSYLRANGWTVFTAPDGKAGLKLAKIERPDLIIMDVMIKERTEGFYAVQQIRHTPELKSVPVIVPLRGPLGDGLEVLASGQGPPPQT